MKMRALIGSVLAVLLLLTVVTGCQGQGGTTKTESGSAPKQTESVSPAEQAEPGTAPKQAEPGSAPKQAEPGSGTR